MERWIIGLIMESSKVDIQFVLPTNRCCLIIDNSYHVEIEDKRAIASVEKGTHKIQYTTYHQMSIVALIFYVLLSYIDMFFTSSFDDFELLISRVKTKKIEYNMNISSNIKIDFTGNENNINIFGSYKIIHQEQKSIIDFKRAKTIMLLIISPIYFMLAIFVVFIACFGIYFLLKSLYFQGALFLIISVVITCIVWYVLKNSRLLRACLQILRNNTSNN